MASFESRMLFPIHVGFWKADDAGIVCGGTASDEVQFSKVVGGVESIGVLQDQSHAVVGLDEGDRVAP